MLYTTFHTYDPQTDKMVGQVKTGLVDDVLRQVTDHLHQAKGGLDLKVVAHDDQGRQVELLMSWDPDAAGFFCSVGRLQAGFLSYDEIAGAQGMPAGKESIAIMVCLNNELDVWRRGVINLNGGSVSVYTCQPHLSYFGAEAYLLESASAYVEKGYFFQLEAGDASIAPLKIPRTTLAHLRVEIMQEELIDPLDELDSLMNEVGGYGEGRMADVTSHQRL